MNKNEFIAAVSENKNLERLGLSKSAVASVIDAALETIETALRNEDEVRLVGFGNFYVAKRAATTGRNPRTGEELRIKASKNPKFRAGKMLKEQVNGKPEKSRPTKK